MVGLVLLMRFLFWRTDNLLFINFSILHTWSPAFFAYKRNICLQNDILGELYINYALTLIISRLTIVSREAKKKQPYATNE